MDIDIKELAKAAAEGFDLSKFKGDVVGVKVVENEIGNVEAGGVGVQKVYNGTGTQGGTDCQPSLAQPVDNYQERDEERFHFVHPEIEDDEAWRIHYAVKRLCCPLFRRLCIRSWYDWECRQTKALVKSISVTAIRNRILHI